MQYRQALLSYIRHLLTAQTKYYLHSPFVYELSEEVIYSKKQYYAFGAIDSLRRQWLLSQDWVAVSDLGAGSKAMGQSTKRKVADIARHAAVPTKMGRLLFGLTHYFKPKCIVELGTSLGISTVYMASACPLSTRIHTIEGSEAIASLAARSFSALKLDNISQYVGHFDQKLPQLIRQLPAVDMVFMDGNHQAEATLNYFEQCLTIAKNGTFFVLDDIHWSKDMEYAWHTIQQHQNVSVTIDLYRCGLVFLRKEQVKQHFKLYF